MKEEMINSIAKEINQHYKIFRDQVVMKELKKNSYLLTLYKDYNPCFHGDIKIVEFASLYSQTVIFVLLSVSMFTSKRIDKEEIYKILGNIILLSSSLPPYIYDILQSIIDIEIPDQLINFILESKDKLAGSEKEDDVLALLYERFLKRYEPGMQKKIKYYYTPGPVVSFMVHTVHNLIKEKLNFSEGLADLDIHVLDPAFGQANFLSAVIGLAIEERKKKYGEGMIIPFVKSYLPNNIQGYEIMLPLYVMGYLNLLKRFKSSFGNEQYDSKDQYIWKNISMGILYLTDALENKEQIRYVKKNAATGVVICNPPYSKNPLFKYESIHALVIDYLKVDERRINEKNVRGLNDMYVKFFRFGQWAIDQIGNGIMAFITNNSYLENPTFRGMRYSLLKSFDEIYILDLHGAARKADKKDGDENVFDIVQGIAIGFFIKIKNHAKVKEKIDVLNCRVYYSSIKGSKSRKLKTLDKLKESNIKAFKWERLFPTKDFYLFTPGKKIDIYEHFIKITDIFPVHGVGIVTARDKLTINYNKDEVYEIVYHFYLYDENYIRKKHKPGDDSRDWTISKAKRDIVDSGVDFIDESKIVSILYRPFDIRYTYYTGKSRGFLCMPRPSVMRHMLGDNIGLITVRQVPGGAFSHCFVTDTIIESRVTSGKKGIAYIFPLYKYIFNGEESKEKNFKNVFPVKSMLRHSNIDPGVFTRLNEIFGMDKQPSSSEIFYYVYAILHSGIYREKYRDHLKIDFPRIPFTSDFDLFMQLSGLGERLASVHLMKSPELVQTFSKYEVIGEDLVDKPHFKPEVGGDGRVYINKTQYFSNIPLELWEQEICGYQVLKKWLWDRKKRILTPGDIRHYIKICRALQLTVKYSKEIDGLYSQLERGL